MEKDIDLSGVDPCRWPEIRRRVEVLDEFVAIRRPSAELREDYARRLDIAPSHLYALASIWRHDRSAAKLPGARVQKKVSRAPRLPMRSLQVVREAIADLGTVLRHKQLTEEVKRRCSDEGIKAPSDSTVKSMLTDARGGVSDLQIEPEILIDECTVKLAVQHRGRLVMPRMLMAVVLPERRIIATDVVFGAGRVPSLSKVMELVEIASTSGAAELPLRAPHCTLLEREMIGALTPEQASGRPYLAKVLGPRLDNLSIGYRVPRSATVETLLATRHSSPIDIEDALTAITGAVDRHNRRMPELPESGFSIGVTASDWA